MKRPALRRQGEGMAYLPVAVSAGLIHAVDRLQGRGVWPAWRELEASQWWPAARLRTLQDDRLRLRTRAAAVRFPLVEERLRAAGFDASAGIGLDDLPRLAPMERDDFVRRRAEIWPVPPAGALPNSTGGSTGANIHFFVDYDCWRQRDAIDLRLWTFLGLGPGARVLSLWGAPMDLGGAARLRQRLRRMADNRRFVSAYAIGDAEIDRLLESLARQPPDVLMGYASVLDRVAVRALRRGGLPGPRFIIPSAEALYPDQRQRLEQAWGAEVFNLYGCREVGLVALECGAHRGLHVMDERLIVERAPGMGAALPEGEGDDLLITDLDNAATSFLRYRIGDRATQAEPAPCPCGRGLSRLGAIAGRSFDIVRGPDGQAVGGTFWSLLLRTGVSGVESFQVVQERIDRLVIRVTPVGALGGPGRRTVTERVREALGPGLEIAFEEVDTLPVLPSGKHRFIVSRLPPESP